MNIFRKKSAICIQINVKRPSTGCTKIIFQQKYKDIYKKINESKYSKEFLYDVTVSDGEKIHYYPCIFLSLEGVAVFDTDVSDKEKRIAAIRKIFDMEELECEIITDVDEFLGLFDEETKSDQGMKEHILTYGV